MGNNNDNNNGNSSKSGGNGQQSDTSKSTSLAKKKGHPDPLNANPSQRLPGSPPYTSTTKWTYTISNQKQAKK